MKLYLIGGFLGSGKTTAIQNACNQLIKKDVRAGVITNDQGFQLVDTRFIKNADLPVMEVTDGCFCCNYDKLDTLIEFLRTKEETEVILAESVGSCTDMIATIVKPMKKFRADIETVISIFVDANVLPTMIQGAPLFVDSVNYIYKKQIEEADILVVNKVDLLSDEQLEKMKKLVGAKFPEKKVLFQNSLSENDIDNWLFELSSFEIEVKASLEIDYDIYGAGEAELAWLDVGLELFDAQNNVFAAAAALAKEIHMEIGGSNLPVGHLKFFIDDGKQQKKISFTSGYETLPASFEDVSSGKADVLINARVQTTPENLEKLVFKAIVKVKNKFGYKIIKTGISSFRPGYPMPTHRIVN